MVEVIVLSWKLVQPNNTYLLGEIVPFTPADFPKVPKTKGWFPWKRYYEKRKDKFEFFKLIIPGDNEIFAVISLKVDGGCVNIDSVEVAKHSRRMPLHQRKFTNLAEVMFAFATYYGLKNGVDGFISLVPKGGLEHHYSSKFKAEVYNPRINLWGISPIVTIELIRVYYT